MKSRIAIEDKAPSLALPSQSGRDFKLGDLLGVKPVVLYFYIRDFSPGCTKQACAFRDNFRAFKDAGAEVIGISSQSAKSHELFSAQHGLPFTLLSDEGGALRSLCGAAKSMVALSSRVTYVIDKEGVVRHIFSSKTDIDRHIEESLRALRSFTQ